MGVAFTERCVWHNRIPGSISRHLLNPSGIAKAGLGSQTNISSQQRLALVYIALRSQVHQGSPDTASDVSPQGPKQRTDSNGLCIMQLMAHRFFFPTTFVKPSPSTSGSCLSGLSATGINLGGSSSISTSPSSPSQSSSSTSSITSPPF